MGGEGRGRVDGRKGKGREGEEWKREKGVCGRDTVWDGRERKKKERGQQGQTEWRRDESKRRGETGKKRGEWGRRVEREERIE